MDIGKWLTLGRKEESEEQEAGYILPEELPVLPLRNTVVFPLTVIPLVVQRPRSVRLVDDAVVGNRQVALVALKDAEIKDPGPESLHEIGTVASIHRMMRTPDGTLHLVVQGIERIRLDEITQQDPYMVARVRSAPEQITDGVELEALVRNVEEQFRRLVSLAAYLPDELVSGVIDSDDVRQLVYLVASSTRMDRLVRQEILELDNVSEKLRRLYAVLAREVQVLEVGKEIQSDAQSGIEKVQREYILREQLKTIQKELGMEDEQAEANTLREKVRSVGMSEEAEREALRELDRLAKLPPAAAEYSVIRTYLDWLTELPWQSVTEDRLDIAVAREVLDQDHYDLVKLKERIIEYLAVRKLRRDRAQPEPDAEQANVEPADGEAPVASTSPDETPETAPDMIRREREGAILCFVGPPGVGKTSLGRSIARAMDREFVRESLGGLHDEAEIRGHRRTYIGAMPGRIIQALRRVGSRNPVFMLDEVDKVGADYRGDPTSALLEVLDPEQNREFRDNYLNVSFDLSQVLFIATANVLDTIPPALRDRMEILQLSGYTEEEKVAIAKGYLVRRQIRENGLRPSEISFEDGALSRIIRDYTREAGVRELERQIGAACRKAAAKVAAGESEGTHVTADAVPELLGKQHYYSQVAERTAIPGVATGLAWTPSGGDILFIEATKMKGSKGFTITGQLGDVMKESAQAALSYIRSNAEALGIDEEQFAQLDIHLHIPAGAIPKDGPSAGVTMATALASLLTNRPIRPDLGMTGEITLRGQVLPVGGIKEKVLAAHRAGLKTICLPRRNENDLDDVPQQARDAIEFILVDRVDDILEAAFPDLEGTNSDKITIKEKRR